MTVLFALASAALATECAPEGAGVSPFLLELQDMDPDLTVAFMPLDAARAREDGLDLIDLDGLAELSAVGRARTVGAGDPSRDRVEVEAVDARGLRATEGLPLMVDALEGVVIPRDLVSATPTPYPHPVPIQAVTDTDLFGVAGMTWVVDGVTAAGIILFFDGPIPVGALGVPVHVDARGTQSSSCELHAVFDRID